MSLGGVSRPIGDRPHTENTRLLMHRHELNPVLLKVACAHRFTSDTSTRMLRKHRFRIPPRCDVSIATAHCSGSAPCHTLGLLAMVVYTMCVT